MKKITLPSATAIRKIAALVVAAMMTVGTTSAVMAAPADVSATYPISVTATGIKSGNTMKLYKLAAFNLDSATNAFSYTLASGLPAAYDTIDELSAITSDGYTFVDGSAANTAADALANGIAKGDITPLATVTEVAGSNDTVAITSLPAGWYVAVVSGTNDSSIIYQNMIINAMPVVDFENNTYKATDNVSLEVKHTNDTITKGVGETPDHTAVVDTDNVYSVGDTVPYEIKTYIPNYPSPAIYATFKITDTPTHLTDDATSVVVKVNGSVVEAGADTFSVAATADKGFVITFVQSYILANPQAPVVVNYNAVINDDAVIAADGETATNTAKITFNPNPNESGEVEPDDTTKLYTYGVDVYKYEDGNLTKKLTGAKFVLYESDGTTVAGAEKEVDSNGYLSWEGLGAGEYKLVETVAPAGYRLDSTPKTVTLSAETNKDNRATASVTETYFAQNDIPNTPGTTLPSTGGIGTTIFYVIGAILVLGAGILLVSKRRMAE